MRKSRPHSYTGPGARLQPPLGALGGLASGQFAGGRGLELAKQEEPRLEPLSLDRPRRNIEQLRHFALGKATEESKLDDPPQPFVDDARLVSASSSARMSSSSISNATSPSLSETRVTSAPRFRAPRRRAKSTRTSRIARAAAPKKCARPCQSAWPRSLR